MDIHLFTYYKKTAPQASLTFYNATRNNLFKFYRGLPHFSLDQGSISRSFYKQLLRAQIPKAQKRQLNQAAF